MTLWIAMGFAFLTFTSCGPSSKEIYEKALADSTRIADSTKAADKASLDKNSIELNSTPTNVVKSTDRRKYRITYMMKDVIYQNDSVIMIKKN